MGLRLSRRPHRQVPQRLTCRLGDYREVKGVGEWNHAGRNTGAAQYGEVALYKGLQRPAVAGSGVDHAAGRQRIEGQRGGGCRFEVGVDIQHYIGGIASVNADSAVRSCRHNRRIRLDAAIQRVHGGNHGLGLSRRPHYQISQVSVMRNHGDI